MRSGHRRTYRKFTSERQRSEVQRGGAAIQESKPPLRRKPMKLGIIGTGNVGCATALAAVARGSSREIVLVNRTRKTAEAVATDIRYGTPLFPKVEIVSH